MCKTKYVLTAHFKNPLTTLVHHGNTHTQDIR